jgi:hypothetical protein
MLAPNLPTEQLEELKALYGEIGVATEGGTIFIRFAALPLPDGCAPRHLEALLCPSAREGYPSRLYFAERPTSGKVPNWHMNPRILERNWHVYSWRVPGDGHRLAQLVEMHLSALR